MAFDVRIAREVLESLRGKAAAAARRCASAHILFFPDRSFSCPK